MTSDVVLTAALRTNLLSLQKTQGSIDITQNRLATGRKVNSALDNPQSFFAAQALNNRASDLTRLLDSIGQSIQVIKAADNGITALTKLVEQADSVATSARDALAGGTSEAKVVGDVDLRGIDDLTTLAGITNAGTDVLTFSLEDPTDGTLHDIGNYGGGDAQTATITIAQNMSTDELISAINNIHIGDGTTANGDQAFEASLDDAGHLSIKTLNGGSFQMRFNTAADNNNAENLAVAEALGFGDIARIVLDQGAGTSNVEFTALADVALRSYNLAYTQGGTEHTADRSTLVTSLHSTSDTATSLFTNIGAATDDYTIGINGSTPQTIELFQNGGAITIQEFIDQINNNTTLNTKIQADFDEDTGQLVINAIDSSVESIEIGIADNNATAEANWGFGLNDIEATATDVRQESLRLASAAGELAQFQSDFNSIREQIDALVNDTGYRGTNLLNGNNLETFFNEDRTSSLTTEGANFTSSGLGVDEARFNSEAAITSALDQVREALTAVRSFGSTLANDLSVIQTRQDFTSELINTLTAGADALTVADQNEEGAKLLALQTRQSLGVTSLSLASQSQQSILRLF
jgi:flagellin-like hook-associated protein FlgL